MPSSNDYALSRAILYARVSTEEQTKSGYSLAQQLEACRLWCAREGYEIVEEVTDPGQSGASLERPGMDRVRDLVATEEISLVLAQDRDRFAREPAYHYLLRREFEEQGTKIRALNDRGDESPEGELTEGILDQLAKYERAKIAERSRRGKLRKAQEGKIVAGHVPNYGFEYNPARDKYIVDEENMRVVRRIFWMVGAQGVSLHGVTRALRLEGMKSPAGGKYWNKKVIRRFILDDVYKPHTFDEISALVAPEVAVHLDPERFYGVWWFNRRRANTDQVSEAGPNGRVYKKRNHVVFKDKSEWIAVPVPDSRIPRELAEAARDTVANNRSPSKLGGRFWELSGAILRCGECGRAMEGVDRYYKTKTGKKGVICYYRCREGNRRKDTCTNSKSVRSDRAHSAVWELVCGLLTDPEQLRADLDAMIEQEKRSGRRGDPAKEAQLRAEKLADIECKREGYWDLAASGDMPKDIMRARIAELEDQRKTAQKELENLRSYDEYLEGLERDRDALLASRMEMAPGALDSLTSEERHQFYKLIKLKVVAVPEGPLEVSGAFVPSQELGTLALTRT